MEETSHGQEKYRSIFDTYLRLESQSYEFIIRSVAMHNWLKEAYGLLQENPSSSADEMYKEWHSAFDQIYRNLFAAFLRPYRAMLHPFGQAFETQIENNPPGFMANNGLAVFKLWGDAQSRFLNGIAGALRSYNEESDAALKSAEQGDVEELQDLTPLGLLRKITDEETMAYYDSLDQFLNFVGENQFLLPKTLIINLQKVVSSYPKAYRLARDYQTMFHETWEKSLKRFTTEIKQTAGQKIEFEQFFKTYVNVFNNEFDSLLRSPKFIDVQSNFLKVTSETIFSMRQVMETRLEMFPASPFATGTEVDALEERVHGYKQRIDGLERRIREMEMGFNLMQRQHERKIQPTIPTEPGNPQRLVKEQK